MPFWCIRQPLRRGCTLRPSQDVSSPIPADHISNTNPLLGSAPLPAAAEAELLELHSKLAFHGRRLFRHEVRGECSAVGSCTLLLHSGQCSDDMLDNAQMRSSSTLPTFPNAGGRNGVAPAVCRPLAGARDGRALR